MRDASVLVGGDFTSIGGIEARRISKFSNGIWTPLGGGLDNRVLTMLELSDGAIVAGGDFTEAGGSSAFGVARWNGAQWSAIGSGFISGGVRALVQLPSGQVVAGGRMRLSGGTLLNRIAAWDGTAWQSLGEGFNATVNALTVTADGLLVAGGEFTASGSSSVNRIASWDGSAWSALGTGLSSATFVTAAVHALLPTAEGLFVGGRFEFAGGSPAKYIAIWTGSQWQSAGNLTQLDCGDGRVSDLERLSNGQIVLSFQNCSFQAFVEGAAIWTGEEWAPLIGGTNPGYRVRCLSELSNGGLLAGGGLRVSDSWWEPGLSIWNSVGQCPTCDSIDFNNDTSLFDPTDIDAFFSVFSEGPCIPTTATCNDLDFNNDGSLFDPCDIDSFMLVFSEGPCTLCGV
jgi:trimeric autotransporter adhesin